MSDHVPYPRPSGGPSGKAGWGRIALGTTVIFCGFGGCCLFSVPLMMAEGPHGPKGEITTDPSAPRILLIVMLISLAVVIGGVFLLRPAKKKAEPAPEEDR